MTSVNLVLILAVSLLRLHLGCTIVAVGGGASETGLPMVSHSSDEGPSTSDVRMTRTPRKTWPKGSVRGLYEWHPGYPRMVSSELSPAYAPEGDQEEFVPLATIPQVDVTWAYWDIIYGMQNEWGLSMGESTCTSKTVGFPATPEKPYGQNHVAINDLSKIALERCKTARCAIETMGEIAVEQGFFSEDSGTIDKPDYSDSAEALAIADADPGEVWVFNIMTGRNNRSAIWAAQRVPHDHVTSVGNSFTIRKMDLKDTDNFMYSPGVADLAIEMGWFDPSAHEPDTFEFFASYGYTPDKPRTQSLKKYYSGRRMWRIFNLLSPSEGEKLDPETGNLPITQNPYPFSVPAARQSVTLEMVMAVHRDHYEGTPFDLTKGMAAGPFGNPNRGPSLPKGVDGQWERAISLHRTSISYICMVRKNGLSLTWTGWDSPHGTAYLPVYGADNEGPPSFHSLDGHMSKFSTKVAWWAFNFVNQYADLNFQLINAEVRAKASKVEVTARKSIAEWEATGKPMVELAALTNQFVEDTVADWWQFAWHLVAKYGRYVVTYNETSTGEGHQSYPEWWANSPEVGYKLWTAAGPNFGRQGSRLVTTLSTNFGLLIGVVSVSSILAALVAFFLGRHTVRRTLNGAGPRARVALAGEQTEIP